MKLIRMLKTMAGPSGVRSPGMKPFTVSDEEADQLVTAEAAEILATIAPSTSSGTVATEPETAALDSAPDEAVIASPKRRPAKKA